MKPSRSSHTGTALAIAFAPRAQHRLYRSTGSAFAGLLLMLSCASYAQQSPEAAPPEQQPASAPAAEVPMQEQNRSTMMAMETMAKTMTRMAELCEQMLQMEMKGMGLKMAGTALLYLLLVVNLILLVPLQILLIRHWRRRLKAPA
jgi:hypothetical protein